MATQKDVDEVVTLETTRGQTKEPVDLARDAALRRRDRESLIETKKYVINSVHMNEGVTLILVRLIDAELARLG